MTIAHRFEQILDKMGESVTIRKRTEGSADEFNVPEFTWSDEATEDAVLTSPTVVTFAELTWTYRGKMESRDRLAYFNQDSVIAENKRVITSAGERYEVDVVDTPTIFGEQILKIAILRRLTEQ